MAKINDSSKNAHAAELFPILPQAPVGISRLAAEAEYAGDGHLIEFKTMQARSILNRSTSKRQLWMSYSINPYRGCEFGCKYCYARYTHEFLQPSPVSPVAPGTYDAPQQSWALGFEREIYLKENAAWLLDQELRHVDPREVIAIGTATDPYQPIERRMGITRSLLEVFAKRQGHQLGLITKSTLIERDTGLLKEIAKHNKLVVHITITTTDATLARMLEPRAPRPDLRFATVRKLREAGITTGVLCSPLLPDINDSELSVEAVAKRAAEAGASFLGAGPLFLKACSRPTYFNFVRENFPHLEAGYKHRFATRDFAAEPYRRHLAQMVKRVCARHGLGKRTMEALPEQRADSTVRKNPATVPACDPQQRLFA